MLMAIIRRGNREFLSRIIALIRNKMFKHTLAEEGLQAQCHLKMSSDSVVSRGSFDVSKWKKWDARIYGINRSMIPSSPLTVLKILKGEGFEAYLVGGCVRDLLLNKMPKDYDVITTATLTQIRRKFHRAHIFGRRFPICMVYIQGSAIEVSSFETVARDANETEVCVSAIPHGCSKKDFILWSNSMHRDFTVNSLFFDPFANKIYDYANGITDLMSFKLRTIVPAQVSFEEDCARILRGLRIAARLGLSISKDTEAAICNLSPSIINLAKSRIMMELNYMLSYGAAEPSLCLLQRFNLLQMILPFHAAYVEEQASMKSDQSSTMLMKLFFNLDKLVTCDKPSDCRLWVALLAFHLALVHNPQDSLAVLAFASILYHGEWNEGIRFAKENSQVQVNFVPEISRSLELQSDEELTKEVSQLASLVHISVEALVEKENLAESMSRYPVFPCAGLVFVPRKAGKDVAEIFQVLGNDVESYSNRRETFEINYHLLGKGHLSETQFVLGKIILETMNVPTMHGGKQGVEKENNLDLYAIEENDDVEPSVNVKQQLVGSKDKTRGVSQGAQEEKQHFVKKCKLVNKKVISKRDIISGNREKVPESADKHHITDATYQSSDEEDEELFSVLGKVSKKRIRVIENMQDAIGNNRCQGKDHSQQMVVREKDEEQPAKVRERDEKCKHLAGRKDKRHGVSQDVQEEKQQLVKNCKLVNKNIISKRDIISGNREKVPESADKHHITDATYQSSDEEDEELFSVLGKVSEKRIRVIENMQDAIGNNRCQGEDHSQQMVVREKGEEKPAKVRERDEKCKHLAGRKDKRHGVSQDVQEEKQQLVKNSKLVKKNIISKRDIISGNREKVPESADKHHITDATYQSSDEEDEELFSVLGKVSKKRIRVIENMQDAIGNNRCQGKDHSQQMVVREKDEGQPAKVRERDEKCKHLAGRKDKRHGFSQDAQEEKQHFVKICKLVNKKFISKQDIISGNREKVSESADKHQIATYQSSYIVIEELFSVLGKVSKKRTHVIENMQDATGNNRCQDKDNRQQMVVREKDEEQPFKVREKDEKCKPLAGQGKRSQPLSSLFQ